MNGLQHNVRPLAVATAPRKDSKRWNQEEISWGEVLEWLDDPADHKECGNYLLGTLRGGRRTKDTIASRSALQLDADHAEPALWDAVAALGVAALAHTTYSSKPGALRMRVIIPLNRDVTPDEYRHIARVVMHRLGWRYWDHSSDQPERYMFRPAAPPGELLGADRYSGPMLDADELLAEQLPAAEPAPRQSGAVAPRAEHVSPAYGVSVVRGVLNSAAQLVALPEGDTMTVVLADGETKLRGWEKGNGLQALARRLVEGANAAGDEYPVEAAASAWLALAPAGTEDKFAHHWDDAVKHVGDRPAVPPDRAALGLLDQVFTATPLLGTVRQAAHARLVSAPALLAYVLARVVAETPPRAVLPPTVGAAASLNLGVAVVGKSGGGKSVLMEVSRELLGEVGEDQKFIEKVLGSGEGLAQTFLRTQGTGANRQLVLIEDPRRILSVDEIDQLGATGKRNGATIAPMLRTALTGGALGQENANQDTRRFVAGGTYRLVLLAGVQPTRSGVLLDEADAGTPQRFIWVPAADPTIPDEDPDWPGTLDWRPPSLPDSGHVDYPDSIKAEVRAARRRQMKGETDELEGHRMLTRLKVGAALALLHGETYISTEWWELAELVVDASMAMQAHCRAVLAQGATEAARAAGRHDAERAAGRAEAETAHAAKAAAAIYRQVRLHADGGDSSNRKHEPDQGCTRMCITRGLRNVKGLDAQHRTAAEEYATAMDWITQRDDRWFPGDSRPA